MLNRWPVPFPVSKTRFIAAFLVVVAFAPQSHAQTSSPATPSASSPETQTESALRSCTSSPGERNTCAADTSAGVARVRANGVAECLIGFSNSHEYGARGNYYWFDSRNVRTNVQWLNVDRSPVGSVFGFYAGGQKGNTIFAATSSCF